MCIILIIIEVIIIGGMLVGLYQKNTNKFCKSKKRFDGKTVLVTGGTTGMGLEIATDFAHRGARVIIACPFSDEGIHGQQMIIKSSGNENVIFKLLDLASFDSIRKFAADILSTEERLDILINNSGVAGKDFLTENNLHCVMQVNYYGTVLMTILFLPLLIKTGIPTEPSRIVNTSSVLHRIGKIEFENFNKINYWHLIPIYGNSKLCLAMFTRYLSKQLKNLNVIVNTVDPGAVGTRIFQSTGKTLGSFLSLIIGILFKKPYEGAQTALYVATSNRAGKHTGEYFQNCTLSRASDKIYNEELVYKVWMDTLNTLKITEEEFQNILNT